MSMFSSLSSSRRREEHEKKDIRQGRTNNRKNVKNFRVAKLTGIDQAHASKQNRTEMSWVKYSRNICFTSSSSMSCSSLISSSWSDLPIDILLNIRDKLELHHRSDLISFRSVCSHWHSAVPIPEHIQSYQISLDVNNNICFTKVNNYIETVIKDINNTHSISWPFFTSSRIDFCCTSKEWLVFKTLDNKKLFLFNPMSNHKIILPRLSCTILKPACRCIADLFMYRVIVHSSSTIGILVVGIIIIFDRDNDDIKKRFVVCRHGVGQKWKLLKESADDIIDITFIDNDHIYALDRCLNLYVLDVRCPSMRFVRFKLWVPKQFLQAAGVKDPIGKLLHTYSSCIEAIGKSHMKIYVGCWRNYFEPKWISLKIDLTELCSYNADADVADVLCEAEWVKYYSYYDRPNSKHFTPWLRPTIIQH